MSASGLHSRPAAVVAGTAAATGLPLTLARVGEPPVPAGSVLMLMSLGLRHGEEVLLSCDDPGAEPALEQLATLLATDLDVVGTA